MKTQTGITVTKTQTGITGTEPQTGITTTNSGDTPSQKHSDGDGRAVVISGRGKTADPRLATRKSRTTHREKAEEKEEED